MKTNMLLANSQPFSNGYPTVYLNDKLDIDFSDYYILPEDFIVKDDKIFYNNIEVTSLPDDSFIGTIYDNRVFQPVIFSNGSLTLPLIKAFLHLNFYPPLELIQGKLPMEFQSLIKDMVKITRLLFCKKTLEILVTHGIQQDLPLTLVEAAMAGDKAALAAYHDLIM